MKDIDYVVDMLRTIERDGIPAASPIEQRWSARSSSPLSPCFSDNRDTIFSWVGVIMYITDEARAPAIKEKFKEYAMKHVDLTFQYDGSFHWGKVDLSFHEGCERLAALRKAFRKRYDIDRFQDVQQRLDPNKVLSNKLVDAIFGV
jgi:L-galactono-1,4-lactone dehydrogenase